MSIINRFGERYFLLRSSADSDKMNDFFDQLESLGIKYESDYKDIGSDNEIAVLVIVSWGGIKYGHSILLGRR